MGTATQTFRFVPVRAATTHTIYNLISPVIAGDEFSQLLPVGTKQIMIRCRGIAKIQFTYTSGETGTKFITIPKGASYCASNIDLALSTLYMEVNKASQVIEVEVWS